MRSAAVPVIALTLALHLNATLVHVWTIQEIQDAPLLVVATVEEVAKQEPVPPGQARSKTPEQYWQASLRVHRSHSRQAIPVGAGITIRYVSYGDLGVGGLSYPGWPRFETGQTALFALAQGERGLWRLVGDEGVNLTVPALVSPPRGPEGPRDGRAFILAELANTLANGDTASRHAAAVYLLEPGAWPDDFREVAERAIGTSDDRWLEVACALLASLGIPHRTVAELMVNPNLPGLGNQAASWALAKGATRDYPDRLIRCLLRNMPVYDWGAANELLEFKDSALVVSNMKSSLSQDPAGSIYVAWVLVHNGQRGFLPEALRAAVNLVSAPEPVLMNRLQASSWLLRDYGSDRQFDVIPATLRRLKTQSEDAYRKLFGSVNYRESQRELRVAAVLIDDRRPGFGTLRYCDVAAATVEKLSGQAFGIRQEMTGEERDRAVARAAAWLSSHPQALRKYQGVRHNPASSFAISAVRSDMRSIRMLSFAACAPSPTAPRPSSVGTPMAAVKFPSEPPPLSDSSSSTPSSRASLCAVRKSVTVALERGIGGRLSPPLTSIEHRAS
jgi:hypothetical protein